MSFNLETAMREIEHLRRLLTEAESRAAENAALRAEVADANDRAQKHAVQMMLHRDEAGKWKEHFDAVHQKWIDALASVQRLSTWVKIDFDTTSPSDDFHEQYGIRAFTAPCNGIVFDVYADEYTAIESGEKVYIDGRDKKRYLPITLPGEGK